MSLEQLVSSVEMPPNRFHSCNTFAAPASRTGQSMHHARQNIPAGSLLVRASCGVGVSERDEECC